MSIGGMAGDQQSASIGQACFKKVNLKVPMEQVVFY